MAVIKANSNDVDLLARLIRAEAEGEGEQGMLMVGNVGVNRILGNCLDFRNIRNMNDMVFQSPGGFEATQKGYFYQRARDRDRQLAQRVINGERIWPASNALWFSARQRLPGNLVQSAEHRPIQGTLLLHPDICRLPVRFLIHVIQPLRREL